MNGTVCFSFANLLYSLQMFWVKNLFPSLELSAGDHRIKLSVKHSQSDWWVSQPKNVTHRLQQTDVLFLCICDTTEADFLYWEVFFLNKVFWNRSFKDGFTRTLIAFPTVNFRRSGEFIFIFLNNKISDGSFWKMMTDPVRYKYLNLNHFNTICSYDLPSTTDSGVSRYCHWWVLVIQAVSRTSFIIEFEHLDHTGI